jgi:Neprosin
LNWLLLKRNGADADNELIGYFPKEIFNNMADASQVQIGGIVYSPDKEDTIPPMGSGIRPGDSGDVCKFTQIAVMEGNGEYHPPDLSSVKLYEPYPEFYEVAIPGNQPSGNGFVIQYGGPGGTKV